MKKNKHKGSSFNSFLEEENISEEVEFNAIKRVIAYELKKAMEQRGITKSEMAKMMKTSRSSLDRILDPLNESATLNLITRAFAVVDKVIHFTISDKKSRKVPLSFSARHSEKSSVPA